jgi:RNA polymerase sigma factor (sigma-70 family)
MPLTLSKTSSPPGSPEHQLVAATRAGDDRAFEQLYARYRERILGFIVSKVHDQGRAEDIAQDVFISALRRLRSNDQQIAFKPWIYEIAKNACIDEFRRGARSREVPLESGDGEFVTDRQTTLSVVSTPSAAVERKQRFEDLRGAFRGLSDKHHQLLVMREFEGRSYDEIGDRLDMSRQMVESGLFRARRKLGEEYEELASGRRCEQIQAAIESGELESVRALGIKERRRVARHLAHCQPCRHVALVAGVDDALTKPRSIAAKIAAFLPFPLSRLPGPWRGGRAANKAASSSHLATAGSLAEPAASGLVLGPAAAAVAVLAIAGGGAGLAHGLLSKHAAPRPAAAPAHHVAHRATGSFGSGGGAGSPAAGATNAGHATASFQNAGNRLSISPARSTSYRPSTSRRSQTPTTRAPGTTTAAGSAPGSAPPVAATGTGRAHGGTGTVAGVTGTVGSTVHTVTRPGKTVGDILDSVPGTVKTVTGTVKTVAGSVPGTVKTVVGSVPGTVKTVTGAVNGVAGSVPGTVKTVTGAVNGAAGSVSGTVKSVTGSVPGTVKSVTGSVPGTVKSVTGSVPGTVKSVTGSVPGTVKNVVNGVQGAANGVTSPGSSSSSTPPAPASSAASAAAGAAHAAKSAVDQTTQGLLGK